MNEASVQNYKYEILTSDSNMPGRVLIYDKPAPDCYTTKHWHKSIEILYVIKGKLWVLENNTDHDVGEGEYILLNSEAVHQTCGKYPEKRVKYLVVHFSYNFIKPYFPAIDDCVFNVDKQENVKNKIAEILKIMANDAETRGDFYELKMSCAMLQILTLLFTRCKEKRPDNFSGGGNLDFEYAKKAIAYIRENYKNKISLEDISSYVGLTPTYFSRYFKQSTRKTFKQYLNLVRLENTLIDMQTKGINETRAALNNGFPSVKAFIATFKSVYDTTPSEYTRLHHEVPSISEIRKM